MHSPYRPALLAFASFSLTFSPLRAQTPAAPAAQSSATVSASPTPTSYTPGGPIDRQALVSRHNVVVREAAPYGAMAVGNGEFAFNFDVTGLNSFPEFYAATTPLGILSNWGWHSFPNPEGYTLDTFRMTRIPKHDREFVYPGSGTSHPNPNPHAGYLRTNPHRFGLGRIGLEMTKADGSPATIADLTDIEQTLDLWGGVATSKFKLEGVPVTVTTAAHPQRDEVGAAIESPLLASGRIKVRIAFPYAADSFGPDYQDWTKPDAHTTTLTPRGADGAEFSRTLDGTTYQVRARWSPGATLTETGKHQFLLGTTGNRLEVSAWFSPTSIAGDADTFAAVETASREGWKKFWSTGGAIDLSGTADLRAAELERRLVLSQYVMNSQESGSLPAQETGLAANSWFGKFHMEMYWWHAAHWALWGRPEILEKSLDSLNGFIPPGEAMAKLQGAKGVKWSKMTAPGGVESPSGVGPVLVWQQPHPVYLAELVWRAKRDRATLERYKDIVFNTADYMATFVDWDAARGQYVLGPGVSSADESHTDYANNTNPVMELAYWKWALQTAQEWRVRMNLPRDEQWDKVIAGLPPLAVRNGVYPAMEIPFENRAATMTTFMGANLPTRMYDPAVMLNTLHAVSRPNARQAAITWGTGMMAACAARLGEPNRAVALLVGPYENNPFRASGYTVRRPDQTPVYMPANGAWLSAAAMMAAGWDGSTGPAPGFPKDWVVRYENLQPMP